MYLISKIQCEFGAPKEECFGQTQVLKWACIECADEYIDRLKEEWMDGWVEREMSEWTHQQVNGWKDGWMDEQMYIRASLQPQ